MVATIAPITAPTVTVSTAAAVATVVATINTVAIAAPIIAALGHNNDGPGRIVRTGIAVVGPRRRIVAIVGATTERGYAATEGE